MPELPVRPSTEYLRKEAKRLAKGRAIQLARAQQCLAHNYGFRTWAKLIEYVESLALDETEPASPLVAAVRARDLGAVRAALGNGANPRRYCNGETPLHSAARLGPSTVVEALIEGGALEWQRDACGRTALELARLGTSSDRAAIVALLDRSEISDASFRAAVAAIHAGDLAALELLLDAEPRLLAERIVGAEAYRKRERADYFRDPKLFWFVANNPTTVDRMPQNIVDLARAMMNRGVDQADLDYALALVMSSSVARDQGHQIPLMRALVAGGAVADRNAVAVTAAHREIEPLRELLAMGMPFDAPLAAALGDVDALKRVLKAATPDDVTLALGLAVINRRHEAASALLEAGADVNEYLPVHSHSTPLHQAAANNDVSMIELLLRAGARSDIEDTLWDGTPLGWARHAKNDAAAAALSK